MKLSSISLLLLILILIGGKCYARSITDMAGRTIVIPDRITRVLPYDNKTNLILFSAASNLMIAKARSMESPMLKYISKDFLNIREVDTKNAEEVLKLKPDILLVAAFTDSENLKHYTDFSTKTGVPMVFINLELMQLDKSFVFLGSLLGKSTQIDECVNSIRAIYRDAAICKKKAGVNGMVYLANDNNGLRTAPFSSNHAQVFHEMGIENVAKTDLDAKGFAFVSMEQLMVWNPDFIFCIGKGENSPYRTVLKSPLWKNINALQTKKVFYVPSEPYLWIDMPPSVNRLLSLVWLSQIFYGQIPSVTQQKVTEFYRVFYKYNLSVVEYNKLFIWQ